jgi:hypothetical protein
MFHISNKFISNYYSNLNKSMIYSVCFALGNFKITLRKKGENRDGGGGGGKGKKGRGVVVGVHVMYLRYFGIG